MHTYNIPLTAPCLFGHWRQLSFAIFPIPAAGLRLRYGNKKQTSKPKHKDIYILFCKKKSVLTPGPAGSRQKKQLKNSGSVAEPRRHGETYPEIRCLHARSAPPTSPGRYTSVRCSVVVTRHRTWVRMHGASRAQDVQIDGAVSLLCKVGVTLNL